MRYKIRTILLILIWIGLLNAVFFSAIGYGYKHNAENNRETIRTSLVKVSENLDQLIQNEIDIRQEYEQKHYDMGGMVRFLQEKDLEETVPSQARLKKYAELLGANYIRVDGPDGKREASWGKYVRGSAGPERKDMASWATTGKCLIPANRDMSEFSRKLENGYELFYQIPNEFTNEVENGSFSWRSILRDVKLPGGGQIIAISKQDDRILVHPNEEKIGKSYEALGFSSEKEFLKIYDKPDKEGIAYQGNMETSGQLSFSGLNLLGQGSGYMETEDMYVICNVSMSQTAFYIIQQEGILIIYVLATFLILCYILFYFRWQRRKEGEQKGDSQNSRRTSRFGLSYDMAWSRRLMVCCVFVLISGFLIALQMETLSNESQVSLQADQSKKLTRAMEKQNQQHRSMLDNWYNETNMELAEALTYVVTLDEGFQTRTGLEEIAERFNVEDIYLFGQNGKMKATNTNYDHIDLYGEKSPRMSRVFLPLLDGQRTNAATPHTLQETGEDEEKEKKDNELGDKEIQIELLIAMAGASIRNNRDLCDGCLGIGTIPPTELADDAESFFFVGDNALDSAVNLVRMDSRTQIPLLSYSQLRMIGYLLFALVAYSFLSFLLGVFRIDRRRKSPSSTAEEAGLTERAGPAEGAPAGMETPGPVAAGQAGKAGEAEVAGETEETGKAVMTVQEHEDLYYSIFGQEREYFFSDRWNFDSTPLSLRSPEKQLSALLKGLIFVLFLTIVVLFFTRGEFLNENSMLRDVVTGGWEEGFNLYAITASEMIIIVAFTLCSLMHRLIYFIARYTTPRAETVCHLVYSMINYAAVLIAIYYCLSFFGVHTRTILAGAGILGIVISFGAQSTIADILSGMFLIFEDVIHVGDFVKVGDNMGMVKRIGVRMTKIQSFGTEISINNADLKAMQNMSNDDARVSCYLSINIDEDLARAEEVIDRELPGIIRRLNESEDDLKLTSDVWYSGVTGVEGAAMTMRFDTYCASYRYGRVSRALYGELIRMCQRNGIRLAVPQTLLKEESGSETIGARTGEAEAEK